jgi:hypothetical protein
MPGAPRNPPRADSSQASEQRRETTEIVLDGVIYMEGFNRATFLKTLEALNMCVEKVEALAEEP